jgi:hypothetical protein
MSLEKLIDAFSNRTELPVEIPEVRDEIVRMGFQDEVVFVHQPMDPGKLRGIYYQYTKHSAPYSEPILCTLIIYSSLLSMEWQRLVCGKEIIHVMDRQAGKTHTPGEVTGLVDKLLGPLSTEDFGLADFMAAVDKLALYQALAILFPDAARVQALDEMSAGATTIEDIAAWASLPLPLVKTVMSAQWPDMKAEISCL